MKVSPNTLITFQDGQIVATQTRAQKSYVIEPAYLTTLAEVATSTSSLSLLDQDDEVIVPLAESMNQGHNVTASAAELALQGCTLVEPSPDAANQDYESITPSVELLDHSAPTAGVLNSLDPSIIADLQAGHMIVDHIDTGWQGDMASKMAHNMARILTQNHEVALTADQASKQFIEMSNNIHQLPKRHVPPSNHIAYLLQPRFDEFKHASLYDTLIKRKTCRNFIKNELSLQQLSNILFVALGAIHTQGWTEFHNVKINTDLHAMRRTSPSATGLNGCEGYVLINNVVGLEPGAYYYNPDKHSLHKTKVAYAPDQISYLMHDQFWASNIAAGVFIVTDLRYTWIKDDSIRGYLATYLEAGHLSQTISLLATACDLCTWISGTFRDEIVSDLLALDDTHMFPAFFVGFGQGDDKAIPENFLKFL